MILLLYPSTIATISKSKLRDDIGLQSYLLYSKTLYQGHVFDKAHVCES